MTKRRSKWLLAMGAILLLTPVFATAQQEAYRSKKDKGCSSFDKKKCQAVPEGGSAASYLLATSLTCMGAMLLRSRASKARAI
jgi:hypothetical protein